jgi:hypothetical protein
MGCLTLAMTGAVCAFGAGCSWPWDPIPGNDPNDSSRSGPNAPVDSGPDLPVDARSILTCTQDPNLAQQSDRQVQGYPASFDIIIQQGDRQLFNSHVETRPCDDMDPRGSDRHYMRIVDTYHYLDGWSNTGVYLRVNVTDPNDWQSNIYFYIRATLASDFDKKGNNPLFVLRSDRKISLYANNLVFKNNSHPRETSVYLYPDRNTAAVATYMLCYGESDGAYYALPLARNVACGAQTTLQVLQSAFTDTDGDDYRFLPSSGARPSVGWENLPSPKPDSSGNFPAMRTDGTSIQANGEVFELAACAVFRCLQYEH